MTRLFPENTPISVLATPDGIPYRIHVLEKSRDVDQVHNRWRVASSWHIPEARAHREYFKLTTTDGLLCTVYRDLEGAAESGAWYIHRIYD